MKVSLRWLKTLTDVPADIDELTGRLALTGTEVDAVNTIGMQLDGVVVGQIISRQTLPDSDHLYVTMVDVGAANTASNGANEPLQIVCGAQNFKAGDKVAVALVGTTLPGGAQIKRTKLRGVESFGMNCSALELGLGTDHEGILILPADAPIGMAFSAYYDLSDTVLDLDITPNRTDCMSMLGVAREVAAIYDLEYHLPTPEELLESVATGGAAASDAAAADAGAAATDAGAAATGPDVADSIEVSIEDAIRCPRYTARVIRGVKVGPSPDWLVARVNAAGTRSVNNIVDITNYIMYETGQPLHAFDLDTLTVSAQGKVGITVRAARPGEAFTTLDEIDRVLDPDVTCIVDSHANSGHGATIALAGVMGGLTSEITDSTVNVLLESATFSSGHTSRTSRRLQLFSESSQRYERIVDDRGCDDFSARAAALITALAGGVVDKGVVDCYPAPRELPSLLFRTRRFGEFVGEPIDTPSIVGILSRLGCEVEAVDADVSSATDPTDPTDHEVLAVIPPSYRPDLLREIDLYEEVLRIWGMDRVTPTLPGGRQRTGTVSELQARERRLGQLLRAMGINETMTYSFVPESDAELLPMNFDENEQVVELINPISSEMSMLRRTILPGLLRSVAYNLNHGVADIMLYEMGTVFSISEGRKQPKERQMLAAVLVGSRQPRGWNNTAEAVDFFDAKGVIEALGRELKVSKLRFKALDNSEAAWLTVGRAAQVLAGSSRLGWVGEVHPRTARLFGVDVPVMAFELEVPVLLKAASMQREYEPISLYPDVLRDLAVVVDASVSVEQVTQVLQSAGGSMLAEVRLFDVFEDSQKLGVGKKSLAFALSYRALDRTLTSEEVEKQHSKVMSKVTSALGGEIRM